MGTGSGIAAQLCVGEEVITSPAISGIAGVSGGTNTVTFASAHGLAVGDQVTLAGFTPSGYNATWDVLSVPSSTTITIGAGLAIATVVGTHSSTTWGRAVTPSRFYELVSEDIGHEVGRVKSKGIRSEQRVGRSDDRALGAEKVAGTVELELSSKNMALLFKHLFGSVTTAGAGPYTHTSSPSKKTGRGLTMQVGRPDLLGTVQPFTWAGVKIRKAEVSCTAGEEEPAKLALDVVGKSETTSTALVAASYTSSNVLFNWSHLAITVGGVAVEWAEFSLSIETPFKDDRYTGGSRTIREPIENDEWDVSGSITLDFAGLTQYQRFVNLTEVALVATFTNGADIIAFTLNVDFVGESPNVDDRDLLAIECPFEASGSTTDASAITVVVTSGESTP